MDTLGTSAKNIGISTERTATLDWGVIMGYIDTSLEFSMARTGSRMNYIVIWLQIIIVHVD